MLIDAAEIIYLLEKPTKDRWPFLYKIRDEASVPDMVTALQKSTIPLTRRLLCYLISLRFRAGVFEKGFSDANQAIPALIKTLDDPDEGVRYAAIDALGDIGDPAAGPALFAQYHKEAYGSNICVLLASALSTCRYTPAIPLLIQALSSSDYHFRYAATKELRQLQAQEAKESLQRALAQETDLSTVRMMHETLQELEHPSTREERMDELAEQLKNTELERNIFTIAALGDIVDHRVIALLLALLRDGRNEVRRSAIVALVSLGEGRDTDWFVQTQREQVLWPLIQALQDQDSHVRAVATQALSRWGDERAIEPLLGVIHDEDDEVRRYAVEAVGYLKDRRALEPLLAVFLTDTDEEVRAFAAQGLGYFEDKRAMNALLAALQNEQAQIRRNAAEMLCWLRDERATDALLQALLETDQEVREWSIEALWQLCLRKGDELSAEAGEKINKALVQVLQDENEEVRAGPRKC